MELEGSNIHVQPDPDQAPVASPFVANSLLKINEHIDIGARRMSWITAASWQGSVAPAPPIATSGPDAVYDVLKHALRRPRPRPLPSDAAGQARHL